MKRLLCTLLCLACWGCAAKFSHDPNWSASARLKLPTSSTADPGLVFATYSISSDQAFDLWESLYRILESTFVSVRMQVYGYEITVGRLDQPGEPLNKVGVWLPHGSYVLYLEEKAIAPPFAMTGGKMTDQDFQHLTRALRIGARQEPSKTPRSVSGENAFIAWLRRKP